MKVTFFSETNLIPTIISIPRDQWAVPTRSEPASAPRPRSLLKKISSKIRAAHAQMALAAPLARLTAAALVFETGKIVAGLLAPELQPWQVAL
jgi:hypothetical protein